MDFYLTSSSTYPIISLKLPHQVVKGQYSMQAINLWIMTQQNVIMWDETEAKWIEALQVYVYTACYQHSREEVVKGEASVRSQPWSHVVMVSFINVNLP